MMEGNVASLEAAKKLKAAGLPYATHWS